MQLLFQMVRRGKLSTVWQDTRSDLLELNSK